MTPQKAKAWDTLEAMAHEDPTVFALFMARGAEKIPGEVFEDMTHWLLCLTIMLVWDKQNLQDRLKKHLIESPAMASMDVLRDYFRNGGKPTD